MIQRLRRFVVVQCESYQLRLFRSSVVAEFDGIKIASLREDGTEFLNEISGSLELIKNRDPRRFRRILETTDYIVSRTLPCGKNSGQYWHSIQATSIDYEPLGTEWEADARHGYFAGIIIHEATHGWLKNRGIVTTLENRIQVERICVTQQNCFYRRIGLTEQLAQQFDPTRWDEIWAARTTKQARMSFDRLREISSREKSR